MAGSAGTPSSLGPKGSPISRRSAGREGGMGAGGVGAGAGEAAGGLQEQGRQQQEGWQRRQWIVSRGVAGWAGRAVRPTCRVACPRQPTRPHRQRAAGKQGRGSCQASAAAAAAATERRRRHGVGSSASGLYTTWQPGQVAIAPAGWEQAAGGQAGRHVLRQEGRQAGSRLAGGMGRQAGGRAGRCSLGRPGRLCPQQGSSGAQRLPQLPHQLLRAGFRFRVQG